ncbi:MAG: InlB B-repeat-containing protein, partial [Thermoplasmata archaeon]|nr:InlB B-repeat-containing protein [Thermoplasmata archaeon]
GDPVIRDNGDSGYGLMLPVISGPSDRLAIQVAGTMSSSAYVVVSTGTLAAGTDTLFATVAESVSVEDVSIFHCGDTLAEYTAAAYTGTGGIYFKAYADQQLTLKLTEITVKDASGTVVESLMTIPGYGTTVLYLEATAGYDMPESLTGTDETVVVYDKTARTLTITNPTAAMEVSGTATIDGSAVVYTVTFHANNGTEDTTTQNMTVGVSSMLDLNTFTYTEHTFLGWSTSATAAEPTYTNGQSVQDLSTSTTGVELYAVWQVNTYTITWNVDGTETTEQVAYGETPSFSGSTDKASTESTDYSFKGWSTDGSTVLETIPTVTGAATYTALYNESTRTYTVSFESMGGSSVDNKTAEYKATITAPSNPTKTGYTFVGWYTSETYASQYDFTTEVTSSFTLYALWESESSGDIEIPVEDSSGTTTAEMSSNVISTAYGQSTGVTISSESTTVELDSATVIGLVGKGDITITVTETSETTGTETRLYDLSITSSISGTDVSTFVGTVTVTLAVDVPSGYKAVVYYVADDGTTEARPTTYTSTTVTFTTDHFSTYAVYFVEEGDGSVIIIPDDGSDRRNPSSATTSGSSGSDDTAKVVACAAAAVAAAMMGAYAIILYRKK